MKQAHIRAKTARRLRVTTDSSHSFSASGNLPKRNFSAMATGQVWVSDITYIRMLAGWLYLTDRKVIGWALSQTMKAQHTSVAALEMALANRPVVRELTDLSL